MSEHLEIDRRQLQRFELRACAVIQAVEPDGERAVELYTRDICSGGAFFPTDSPLPAGMKVRITLFLIVPALRQLRGNPAKIRITTDGTVVRSESEGMAVAFGPQYEMILVAA